jgi:hypothetical protein
MNVPGLRRATVPVLSVLLLASPGVAGASPAASAATSHALISCSRHPKQHGKEKRHVSVRRSATSPAKSTIELWYSATCRTAWAVEAGGVRGDHLWVYNRGTHARKTAKYPHSTVAISDNGTKSRACMKNPAHTVPPGMAKACTKYF